jgi:hypothetical protein
MVNLFFSYSHKDESLRDELEKHLSILKRNGIIDTWHDRRIEAGSVLDASISNNLKNSQIILLLVSSDFLASDYCYDIEMKEAMRLHESKQAVVIPIILRPCEWQDSPFGSLLAAPTDGKPVTKFPSLDEAFLEVTKAIKKVAQTLTKGKQIIPSLSIKHEEKPELPRSSNLRITKTFSDHDKDRFLDEAFDYMANFFEGSLLELKKRNPDVDSRFKKVDAHTFTASVYRNGQLKSECMIYLGGSMFNSKSINYSRQISASRNSLNESLSITDNGYTLQLKPVGMQFTKSNSGETLTNEGASEYFWELFIEPLKRAY